MISVSGAFSLMQGDFDGIYTKLTDFETNIGKTELFYRKIGGRDLKQAEGKWAEVHKASCYIPVDSRC